MIVQEKLVIGRRHKESKSVYKKGFVAAVFLGIAALALAIISMFIKADDDDKIYKTIVVSLLLICSIASFCFIPLINKARKQILEHNTYPNDAILFDKGELFIVTDKTTKIKITDIEKVEIITSTKTEDIGLTSFQIKEHYGNLNIVTKDEKLFVPQIINVEKVKDKIMQLKEVKLFYVDEICFVQDGYNRLDFYEATCIVDDIKVNISLNNSEREMILSADTVKTLIKDFSNFYKNLLNEISSQILDVANEWNLDNKITFNSKGLENRIDKKELDLSVSGEDYTVYLDDDGVFFGHTIVCRGNINDKEIEVDIAG